MRKPSRLQKKILKALRRKRLTRIEIYRVIYPEGYRNGLYWRRKQAWFMDQTSNYAIVEYPAAIAKYHANQSTLTDALNTLIDNGRIHFTGTLYQLTIGPVVR